MPDQLNHVLTVVAHGMLTELPAQLATAAVMAGSAALCRHLRRRRAKAQEVQEAEEA
ncbi:hypothetical protein [Streptomyces cellostaticus]|uniref:hypothetical protein n=1 Tax=Streptomyces cellostaticus TaxID=67285 RepID=UPI000AF8A3E7|nr:hypothetical protein [Streptomyces cellostaticus]GHI05769.1 hypothetical protein Scel_40900 [Streptomyces cellostaticus]